MQHETEIEMQIWDFLEGRCIPEENTRVASLITSDAQWKRLYEEARALHARLQSQLEPDHTPMRFRADVMDRIAREQPVPGIRSYLNIWVIRGIAASFALSLTLLIIQVFVLAPESSGMGSSFPSLSLPRFRMPDFTTQPYFWGSVLLLIAAALAFVDILIRKRRYLSDAGNGH